jgi:hypothetical protein
MPVARQQVEHAVREAGGWLLDGVARGLAPGAGSEPAARLQSS